MKRKATEVTWEKLAWAAVFFHAYADYKAYEDLMRDAGFLARLRARADTLDVSDVCSKLVGFLNKWKSRVRCDSAAGIRRAVAAISRDLSELKGLDLVDGHVEQVHDMVGRCYERVDSVHGLGPTATSKILHVLQPRLFMMWDEQICKEYECRPNAEGYHEFLRGMMELAEYVREDFRRSSLNPPRRRGEGLEEYLSDRMNSRVPKTMAKCIDEYNWVAITRGVTLPPEWHP